MIFVVVIVIINTIFINIIIYYYSLCINKIYFNISSNLHIILIIVLSYNMDKLPIEIVNDPLPLAVVLGNEIILL